MPAGHHETSLKDSLAIRTENLCRHYSMGEALIRAVDGISVQVASGEFVALLGASGSGKSSLLNLIAGLDRPTFGTVVVQKSDLAKLSREELAKYRLHTVGMVFRSFNLIPSMTLLENVELPLRFAEVDRGKREGLAKQALDRVGLSARLRHRPTELSDGEHQRPSLARALFHHPRFLLEARPTRGGGGDHGYGGVPPAQGCEGSSGLPPKDRQPLVSGEPSRSQEIGKA